MAKPRYTVAPLPAPHPAHLAGAPPADGSVAILVAHGMGQQIPFQTLDLIAEGLQRIDVARRAALKTAAAAKPVARAVLADGQRLQRLELKLLDTHGVERDVHLYEAYWAPLTEGQVTLRDVIAFLFRGARGGLQYLLRPFRRALFNTYSAFPIPGWTALQLALACAVVSALTMLNVVIVAVGAARAPFRVPPGWLTDAFFADLTRVIAALVAVFAVFLAALGLAKLTRRAWPPLRRVCGYLSVVSFAAALAATIAAAVTAALLLYVHHGATPGDDVPFLAGWIWPRVGNRILGIVLWSLVIAAAFEVRHFLIQYVGDVAAYVQPQQLDRFYELRQKIKDAVWKTAHAVYSVTPAHSRVLVVGHSLGSVVIYDVLNRLLIDEALGAAATAGTPGPAIRSRTALLLTFGSPLDKTAFLFGAQSGESEAREALASVVQPIIGDPAARLPWINLYSRWDIISGRLDYYDVPPAGTPNPGGAPRVDNEIDRNATTLLAAHVEYWQNEAVFRALAEHL